MRIRRVVVFFSAAFLSAMLMGGGCPQGGADDEPLPQPIQDLIDDILNPPAGGNPNPPNGGGPSIQKLGELPLGGVPTNIALDLANNLGFVGVDKRIRRFDPVNRVWKPLTTPNGAFYAIDPLDDIVGLVNPTTGKINQVIAYPESSVLNPPLNAGFAMGMDYNPDTGKLYVIDIFSLGFAATLFEFDPATGVRTQIGETGLTDPGSGDNAGLAEVSSLARDPATGMLYTVMLHRGEMGVNKLWRIDPTNATAELVSGADIGFGHVRGLSFSPLDGKLYGINPPLNGPVQIITIDTTTGLGTLATELPLGRTGGSLAFKPDGTLWSVNLLGDRDVVTHTDYLYQINYLTNPATVNEPFDTLEFTTSFPGFNVLFQAINGLCFAQQGGGDQFVPTFQGVDAVGVDHDGGVMASAGSGVFGFDPEYHIAPGGINPGGLQRFQSIAVHPVNDVAYVRDGISGKVYEFVPGMEGVTNTIQYRPAAGAYFHPRQPDSGIDSTLNMLYLVGDAQMHRVNLATGQSDEIDDGVNDHPEGVFVDPVRRRLHVNMQFGGPNDNCGSIRTYNLDTMEELNDFCATNGPQLFNMAWDPVRNRIAVNCRTSTQFDMTVRFFNMDTFTEEPFSPLPLPRAADNTNAVDAFLALDPVRNQLIVARPDTPARVEFYKLPS